MGVFLGDYNIFGKRDDMNVIRDKNGKYASVIRKDEGESCPIATQDPELNSKNRSRTIKIASYGMPKAGTTDLCGNCKVFNIKKSMLECIDEGLPVDNPMEGGDRGYCESFQFACSASHTCAMWTEGGPIEDEEESNIKIELEIEIPVDKAKNLKVGDFVRWDSNASVAQGKIEKIVYDGKINVPDSTFEVKGEPDNPAVLIRIYKKFADGWEKTDRLVGHKASTLRSIQDLA